MKKVLAVLLSFLLLFSTSISAFADYNWDDFDISDGIFYGYFGDETNLTVPNEDQNNLKIYETGAEALRENTTIKHLKFENGIEVIGGAACNGMKELESVELPATLENFGYGHNFIHCDKLKSITVPGNTAEIPRGFVFDCDSLTDITISYGVEVVSWYSIGGTNLTKVVFPETVSEIHGFAMNELKSNECEVTICNPDCELGKGFSEEKVALDNDPLENNPDVKFTIIVPENSKVEKYYSSMDKLPGKDSVLVSKPSSYFETLEENQENYGLQYEAPVYKSELPEETTENDGENDEQSSNIVIYIVIGAMVLAIILVVVFIVIMKRNKGEKL